MPTNPTRSMTKTPGKSRNLTLVLCSVVIAAALSVRVWHDRNAAVRGTNADLEQQAREHPKDEEAQLDWGIALDNLHRFEEAEASLKSAAALAPRDVRPIDALARLAMERHQAEDALQYMTASLSLNPNNAANWSSLGTMLLKRNAYRAQQAFEHATKLDPNDAFSWLQLGSLEANLHQGERGLRDLQRAAALNMNDLETEIALGNCALSRLKPMIAKEAFGKALKLKPDDPQALLGAANVTLQLDTSAAGLALAGAQLNRVMAVSPTANAYLVRGHWNLLKCRYQAAATDLNTALALAPQLGVAHSFLSQCYAATGKAQLARRESAAFVVFRTNAAIHLVSTYPPASNR